MNINNNFIGSRMNKSLDERLIPQGDYIDALNIRISSDEDGESGSLENAKGNELVTSLTYNSSPLVDATCIGAFEDGEQETIYWFVTSPTVDMIVSYNFNNSTLIYHIISTDILNFSTDFRIESINLIDDLLFFTDNLNPPRKINTKRSYPRPITGQDQITEDDISVIVKPPIEAPGVGLVETASTQNYIEDKFARFSYRYKYKDGEYSALSEFSDIAFLPGVFKLDFGNYDMTGMRNRFNSANVSFNTGSKHVIGIDICFKLSNSNVVHIIEKFDKAEEGWGNNEVKSVQFSNQKIFTTLPESELLRLFDNVPKLAKEQTLMGNRIMYGNYTDGYDIDTNIDYDLSLVSELIGDSALTTTHFYNADTNETGFTVDLDGLELVQGLNLFIDLNILHVKFVGDPNYPMTPENDVQENWSFQLPRDYTSVQDLVTSTEWNEAIELTDLWTNTADGDSMTDVWFTAITAANGWDKVDGTRGSGPYSVNQEIETTYSGTVITFDIPGVRYESGPGVTPYASEFFENSVTVANVFDDTTSKSLHSNRDYEVAIEYLDEYERASTALVSTANSIYVGSELSTFQNKIRVTLNSLAPSWASRYRFVLKPSKGDYETIYSRFYYQSINDGGAWWIRLEGDNQTKAKVGDTLIVKADSSGPAPRYIETKVLDLQALPYNDAERIEGNHPAGLYMKLRATNFSISSDPENERISRTADTRRSNSNAVLWMSELVDPDVPGVYQQISIPAGAKVSFSCNAYTFGSYGYEYVFNGEFTAQNDYDNIGQFINGENITFSPPTVNSGQGSPADGDENRFKWFSAVGDSNNLYQGSVVATPITPEYSGRGRNTDVPSVEREMQMKYYENPADPTLSWLMLTNNSNGKGGRPATAILRVEIERPGDILVFETKPEEIAGEIYYQSSKSYPIQSIKNSNIGLYGVGVSAAETNQQTIEYTTPATPGVESEVRTTTITPGGPYFVFEAVVGSVSLLTIPLSPSNISIQLLNSPTYTGDVPTLGHYGNVSNQTATGPAVIDLELYNCFSFGNGVESFKINDGFATPGFRIGARTTAVSLEDYREVNRYFDITYSGVYNQQTNINKLNEFNLALGNYKSLEASFGPINKLHGRQTDILVLQEDKISYVLAGKNLLSDAAAGGAITSIPEVLGTQIARTEEIGISNDTASFATESGDVFFTDSKRGMVLNLKGGSYQGETLNIISTLGMRSWFRDEFSTGFNKIKLGGFDPYMNEYVLTFGDYERPLPPLLVGCGTELSYQDRSTPVTFNVQLNDSIGDVNTDYNFISGAGNITITYNGIEIVNADVTGSGQLSFNKDIIGLNECIVTVTPSEESSFTINANCIADKSLTIIHIVKNTDEMDEKIIHHEYQWASGTYSSPVYQQEITFDEGPVSYYRSTTGIVSQGEFPVEGSTIRLRYAPQIGDTASWEADRFQYHLSDTLYTESEIDLLKPLLTTIAEVPSSNPVNVQGEFTYSNPTSKQYLYLVYDYVSPVIECGVAVNTTAAGTGAYEMRSDLGTDIGFVTVAFDGYNTPTRLQLVYDGSIVADSLFIGDVLPDATQEGLITSLSTLDTYNYNGSTYDLSNSESVTYTSADIAVSDGSELRSSGDGTGQTGVVADFPSPTAKASDGSVKLKFLKSTSLPTEMTIRVITANGTNNWSMNGVTCPSRAQVPDDQFECTKAPLVTPDVAGFWNLNSDIGVDTGAVVITMRPKDVTDTLGSIVEYNGVTYNTFVSDFDGTHKSDTDGNYTWVGATIPSSPQVRDEYTFDNGSFVDTGNDVSQVVAAGDVSTSSFPVGSTTRPNYTIVIPKIETNIEALDFKVFSDTEAEMIVRCPRLLNSAQVDGPYEFPDTAINPPGVVFRDFFTAHKSGIGTSLPVYVPISDDPILHCEQLFLDANGIQTLQKGYYYTNDIETPPEFTNQDQYKIIYVDDWGTAYYYTPEEISENPCNNTTLVSLNNSGHFDANIELSSSTGAVVIHFHAGAYIPDGILATYDNNTYNILTSQNIQFYSSQVPYGRTFNYGTGLPTYVGAPDNFSGSPYQNVEEYSLQNGSYQALGTTRTITVASTQNDAANQDTFTLVVPKTSSFPSSLNLQIFAPLSLTSFSYNVSCPTALPSFSSSVAQTDTDCNVATETYYFARNATYSGAGSGSFITDTNTIPKLGNFVYEDSNAATPLNDNTLPQYYIIDQSTYIQVRYGMVIDIGPCIQQPIECSDGMDVAFIMDYTGSMTDEIDTLKAGFTSLINTIDNQSGANNYRVAIVTADERGAGLADVPTYNDCTEYTSLPVAQRLNYAGGNDHQLFITAWEMFQDNNGASATTAVNNLNGGGFCIQMGDGTGSGPECTDQAIGRVLNDNFVNAWRPNVAKYIIVGTDVLPGGDDGSFTETDWVFIQSLVASAVSEGVKIFVLGSGVDIPYQTQAGPYVFPWRYLSEETGGDWDNSFETTTINSQIIASCTQQP